MSNQTYNASYGEGGCDGILGTDYVGIVGTPINTTYQMSFVYQESGFADTNVMDGIMGLTNWNQYTNLFQDSYLSGQLTS